MRGWNVAHATVHTTPMPRSLAFLFGAHLAILRKPRLAVGVVLQQTQGMRPGEMLQIRKKDCLLPELQGTKYCFLIISLGAKTGTKAKRVQSTVVRDPLLICLVRWIIESLEDDDMLCGATYGEHRILLKRICELLKLPFNITPHSPRAGFASDGVAQGIPRQVLMDGARWTSETSFRVYVDLVSAAAISVSLRSNAHTASMLYAETHFLSFFAGAHHFAHASDGHADDASSRHIQSRGRHILAPLATRTRASSEQLSDTANEESEDASGHGPVTASRATFARPGRRARGRGRGRR